LDGVVPPGGVVTAMFRTSTAPPGQARPSQSPPIADAGPDRTVMSGGTFSLDGTLSHDPDGDPITFVWTLNGMPMLIKILYRI